MTSWITSMDADTSERQQRTPESQTGAPMEPDVTDADAAEHTVESATDDAGTPDTDDPTSPSDLLGEKPVSKQAVYVEFGLQPHEFLAWLVRDAGGKMWQTDLVRTTGWAKSTVSRYLETLEANGTVTRVLIGRNNLVGIPGEMPDIVSSPDADATPDGSSTDHGAGSWIPKADESA